MHFMTYSKKSQFANDSHSSNLRSTGINTVINNTRYTHVLTNEISLDMNNDI